MRGRSREHRGTPKLKPTDEDRIRAHYRGLKRSYGRDEWDGGRYDIGDCLLALARHYKRPIHEIKNILGLHGRTDWKEGETWYTGNARTMRGPRISLEDILAHYADPENVPHPMANR